MPRKNRVILLSMILMMGIVTSAKSETPPATKLLQIARTEIGKGETIANNQGQDIKRYGADGLPWCAAFVSYCLKQSGYSLPYFLRAKSYLKVGKQINNPQAGDLIIFSRQGGGHIGIIEQVNKDKIITIEGNLGKYPSKVKRVIYSRNNIKNLLGFVRLAKGK